jgi:hypothetical protein
MLENIAGWTKNVEGKQPRESLRQFTLQQLSLCTCCVQSLVELSHCILKVSLYHKHFIIRKPRHRDTKWFTNAKEQSHYLLIQCYLSTSLLKGYYVPGTGL